MKLHFKNEEINIEQPVVIKEIIEKINVLLGEQYYFSHLIIDGEEIRENPEAALLEHSGHMKKIEVIAIEAKEFINDLLLSAEAYLGRAGSLLEDVAERFYDAPSAEDYQDLNDLFGGLQWLTSMIEVVDQSVVKPVDWALIKEEIEPLKEAFNDFEEALENEDTVLLADLLSYEVKPVFEKLKELITQVIDAEGERHELH